MVVPYELPLLRMMLHAMHKDEGFSPKTRQREQFEKDGKEEDTRL